MLDYMRSASRWMCIHTAAVVFRHIMQWCVMSVFMAHRRYSWLVDVHMDTGALTKVFISSLAAFWPGMQALIGEPWSAALACAASLHPIAAYIY